MIDHRQHYKCIGEKGLSKKKAEEIWSKITVEEIIKYKDENDSIEASDIAVKKFKINHGLSGDHPLHYVKFYDNKDLSYGSFKLNEKTLKSMLPKEN